MDQTRRKYAFRAIKSTQLGRALDRLNALYLEQHEPDYLVIPYLLTCAAFMEAKLNDSFHDVEKHYGEEFAAAMQSLSLPKKLVCLVPVLTHGRFDINKNHFVYQRLTSLIRTRNSIAHAKSELTTIEVPEAELVSVHVLGSGMNKIPKRFLGGTDDVTLGASSSFTPLEYHDALNKLEKWFFRRYPDRLSKVAMVIERTNVLQSEEPIVSYTMEVK